MQTRIAGTRLLIALAPLARNQTLWAILIMFFAHVLVLQNIVWPGIVVGDGSDTFDFFLPHSAFLQHSIRSGEFPLWNPYLQYGSPEFWQLHPLVLLIHLVSPSGVFAYKLYLFLPGLLVGIGAWLFVGRFIKPFPVRILGALMVQFGPYSFWYMVGPFMLLGYAHFPFLLYFAEQVYRRPSSRTGYLGMTATAGMLVLNMYPHTIVYGLLGTGIFFTGRVFLSARRRQLVRPWVLFALFAVLGVGVGSVSLLLLQVAPGQWSPWKLAFMQSSESYLKGSFSPRDLLTFLVLNPMGETTPPAFGFSNNLFPWLTLGLLLFVIRPSRLRTAAVLGTLVVLAYFIALGKYNPAYVWLVDKLPYYARMDNPQRALQISSTLFPLLASLGYLSAYLRSAERRRDILAACMTLVVFLLSVLLTEQFGTQDSQAKYLVYVTYGLASILIAGSCLGLWDRRRVYLFVAALVVLGVSGPLLDRVSHTYFRDSALAIPVPSVETNRAFDFLPKDPGYWRQTTVIGKWAEKEDAATLARMEPDTPLLYNRFSTGNYMFALNQRGSDFEDIARDTELHEASSTLPLTRMSAVRWVISTMALANTRLLPLGTLQSDDNTTYFYEVPDPLPRVFVPPEVIYAPGKSELSRKGERFEPAQMALIDAGGRQRPSSAGQQERSGPGTVRIVEYKNQRVELEANMDNAGWVVLSDTYYPGWEARVDGEPAGIYQANYLFRSVLVPEGKHTIVFSYFPPELKLGLAIMIVSVIAAIGLAWPMRPGSAMTPDRPLNVQ